MRPIRQASSSGSAPPTGLPARTASMISAKRLLRRRRTASQMPSMRVLSPCSLVICAGNPDIAARNNPQFVSSAASASSKLISVRSRMAMRWAISCSRRSRSVSFNAGPTFSTSALAFQPTNAWTHPQGSYWPRAFRFRTPCFSRSRTHRSVIPSSFPRSLALIVSGSLATEAEVQFWNLGICLRIGLSRPAYGLGPLEGPKAGVGAVRWVRCTICCGASKGWSGAGRLDDDGRSAAPSGLELRSDLALPLVLTLKVMSPPDGHERASARALFFYGSSGRARPEIIEHYDGGSAPEALAVGLCSSVLGVYARGEVARESTISCRFRKSQMIQFDRCPLCTLFLYPVSVPISTDT